jgi:hypothetical protein
VNIKQEVVEAGIADNRGDMSGFTGGDVEAYSGGEKATHRSAEFFSPQHIGPAVDTRRISVPVAPADRQDVSPDDPPALYTAIKSEPHTVPSTHRPPDTSSSRAATTAGETVITPGNLPPAIRPKGCVRVITSKRCKYPRSALIGISSDLSVPQRMTAKQALNVARNVKKGDRYIESAHSLDNEQRHGLEDSRRIRERWLTREEALRDTSVLFLLAYCRDKVIQRYVAMDIAIELMELADEQYQRAQ